MKSLRLLGSLVAVVLLQFGCSTVPETGRSQVVWISADEEAQMGLAAFSQIKQEEKVSQDPIANDRVTEVGKRIARSVGRDLPNAKWEFVVFDSDELNAFALPGGKVGVYTGILKIAQTDDELAAVMGHEIAHVTSRHSGERFTHQMIAGGAALVSELVMEAKEVDQQKRAMARAALGGVTTVGAILPFSRLHESEADAIGLRFAAGAGYDPRAAIQFWERMQQANEGREKPPEFLSTHPSDETRIANLKQLAPQYLPLYRESKAKWDSGQMDQTPMADKPIGAP